MPKLIRLYITQVLIGFGIAAIFVGLLLWLDVANLWTLIQRSDVAVLAIFILWFMNGIVFAGVQFAWAVMSLAEKDDTPKGGSRVAADLVPVRAIANPGKKAR
ncbi:hypothetical protein M3P21_01820 [Ruegeria sp. 2012CJ41-6]|uniref:Uncharacterized protein n=1 Tax=Ruegeria spongiae TaxID=2942209 RepID=A0ABT0PY20_9RHOB|nr:hypothetical protein [Ruegeria spongiae]MCL6282252.1 hypothetical protein [Ruegeria spongiae]